MKFLITGSIRSARGPRLIVTFTLIFLLLFLAAHGLRDIQQTGYYPSEIQASLFRGNAPGKSRSFLIVLEDLHIDLLLYSIVLLFVTSLLNECGLGRGMKTALMVLLFSSTLIYALSRPGAYYVKELAWLVFGAGHVFHVTAGLSMTYLLYYLWSSPGKGAHEG